MKIKNVQIDLTKEQAISLHRILWEEITKSIENDAEENLDNLKRKIIYRLFGDIKVTSNCFLCDYACSVTNEDDFCKNCPLDWETNESCVADGDQFSYYEKLCIHYRLGTNKKGNVELAKKIANLKEKQQ